MYLHPAFSQAPTGQRIEAGKDFKISDAVFLNFHIVANEVTFYQLRSKWKKEPRLFDQMRAIVRQEPRAAERF
jgi:hypothetical protein